MLAECETEIYASEGMMRDITARAEAEENVLRKAAAFKLSAAMVCSRIVDRCVQIYGGAGYLARHMLRGFHSGTWG